MGNSEVCNCFGSSVNRTDEFKSDQEIQFITAKDQVFMDNQNIRKKILQKDNSVSEKFDEIAFRTKIKSDDEEEFNDHGPEIPKKQPRAKTRPKIPFEEIPKDESQKYSVGEILSRALYSNVDFTTLIPGVKYPIGNLYSLPDESVYRGEFDEKFQPHGRGFLFFPDDSIYIGYFFEGQPKGQGKYLTTNKILTEGNFISVQEEVSTHNGMSLVIHGEGAESWPDKTTYFGNFHMGVKQGTGKLSFRDCIYEGEFYNGLFNGKGKLTLANGDIFVGEWKDGLKHGEGELRQKNGKLYKGFYENDEKSGNGTMVWPDKRRYKGEWKNGKMHGVGMFTYFDKNKGRLRTSHSEWDEGARVRWISPNARDE